MDLHFHMKPFVDELCGEEVLQEMQESKMMAALAEQTNKQLLHDVGGVWDVTKVGGCLLQYRE